MASHIGRRKFLATLGGVAAAWPIRAEAQQSRMPVLGFLASASEAAYTTTVAAVRQGLNEAGYSIPIVFANGSDPVQYGLVASLNRPGGNITGISYIEAQLGPKRIQLLRLLNPKAAVIAVLVNPKNPNAADAKTYEAAGRSLGVDIVFVNASTEQELKEAFDRAV